MIKSITNNLVYRPFVKSNVSFGTLVNEESKPRDLEEVLRNYDKLDMSYYDTYAKAATQMNKELEEENGKSKRPFFSLG